MSQRSVMPTATGNPTLTRECYIPCDNAYTEAQAVRRKPEICASDSVFNAYYQVCPDCIDAHGGPTKDSEALLDSESGDILEDCGSAVAGTSTTDGPPTTFCMVRLETCEEK
ncbi:hypothetical protein GGR57DRAFT_506458 [Xylariaceae sp. FL1272]|nr:hypothetical protein GGR57DRAFT_506458 [Xylariaceae sp. FL1272]